VDRQITCGCGCGCGCGSTVTHGKRFVQGHNLRLQVQRPALERFSENVRYDIRTGCWLWTGAIADTGYGIFSQGDAVLISVHRWAYRKFRGPLRARCHLHHICERRACCNPDHLEQLSVRGHGNRHRSKRCQRGHWMHEGNYYYRPERRRRKVRPICLKCCQLRGSKQWLRK
jgi:hypothetical protein